MECIKLVIIYVGFKTLYFWIKFVTCIFYNFYSLTIQYVVSLSCMYMYSHYVIRS